MPDLARLGSRFDMQFRDLKGRQFYGRFAEVSEGNPTQVTPQKRLLRVHKDCALRSGDIVLDRAGLRYLLADGPVAMGRGEIIKKTFRCIELNRQLPWTRMDRQVDAVMNVSISAGTWTTLGQVWCQLEPREERLERSSKVASSYEKWKCYTNVALLLNDKIGMYSVTRSETIAGVTVADVE